MDSAAWTLVELTERVKIALEAAGLSQENGQITDVPNGRTIRYYATIGLLDRPRADGRHALYGPRHLAQLVAIKRLQAQGLTLAQVQERLLGLDDRALDALAALPAADRELPHGPAPRRETRRADAFWSAPPAPAPAEPPPAETAPAREPLAALAGITLPEGVTLTWPVAGDARALSNDDMDALRAALRPIVDTLRERGLL